MIRVLVFLALLAALALGAVWLADRPGDLTLVWQGREIRTTLMVAVSALAAVIVVAILVWSLIRFLLRTPDIVSLFFASRRRARAFDAITRGMVAVGAGDLRAARRHAYDARRLAGDQPLALLLQAQTAQLAGDRGGAAQTFLDMADKPETRLIGLRGLYMEAVQRGDAAEAQRHAQEAARIAPGVGWAGQAVLDFQCAQGDWDAALDTLDRNVRNGVTEPHVGRRQKAVLLTAQAVALEEIRREDALALATEALKAEPALVPAAVLAGRIHAQKGDIRRASKILETAWKAGPHPDIADAYAHVRLGDSARDRLKRVKSLVSTHYGHVESALALARAAIEATDYDLARQALQPHLAHPTQRVCLAMAKLEQGQSNNIGAARSWIARAVNAPRDATWTADGMVSASWLPVSPVTGRLDAFAWKAPVATIAGHDPTLEDVPAIEPDPPPVAGAAAATGPQVAPPAPVPDIVVPPKSQAKSEEAPEHGLEPEPARDEPDTPPPPPAAAVASARPAAAAEPPRTTGAPAGPAMPEAARPVPAASPVVRADDPDDDGPRRIVVPASTPAAPIIPFVQAPDDPGPGGDPNLEDRPKRRFGMFG